MNVRQLRLEADWKAVEAALTNHPKISILGAAGKPPQRYHLEYRVQSLVEGADGQVRPAGRHEVEISLLRSYPQQSPFCRMLTPVFHPNIAPHAICIGDHWSAGESLVALIFRIGEILAYQSYNIKSPLNGLAAKWVEQNPTRLPTDPSPLLPPGTAGVPGGASPAGDAIGGFALTCDKCNRTCDDDQIFSCEKGHTVCEKCRRVCLGCGRPACPVCGLKTCVICFTEFCSRCTFTCSQCGRDVCGAHGHPCATCGQVVCQQCTHTCIPQAQGMIL